MIRNKKTYKQIILSLVITTTLVTFNITSALAKTLGGTYKSAVVVTNFNELEDEIAEALKIGAVTAEINLDDKFLAEFNKGGGNLKDLITASGFKADDYHSNVIKQYGISYGGKLVSYKFEYLETTEETKAVEAEVQKILGKIITPNMKEEEKLKVIHDYIVTNVEYDSNGLRSGNSSHSAYAALFKDKGGDPKETVCQGYALLFYRMAIDAGLEARIMTGNAGEAHAWNLVKVNGNWYQIDLTWNDPVGIPDKNYKRYDYYNLTDDQIKKDHKVFNNPEKYPKCTTNYEDVETNEVILEEIGRLKTNDLKVTTEAEFKARILEEIAKGKTKTTIKYEGLKSPELATNVIWKVKNEQRNVLNDLQAQYLAKDNGIEFYLDINYKDSISSIKAENNSYNMTLAKPEKVKIIAKTKLAESKDITNNSVYVSSNTKVVTVDRSTGELIPHSVGDAKIIVKYGGVQDEILVKVNDVAAKSTNSNLSKLNEDNNLIAGFSKDVLSYTKQLPAGTTNIPVIKADKEDPKASIDIVQAKNLTGSEEERTAKINVKAEDGSIKTYKVVFSLEAEVKPVADPVVKPVADPVVKPVVKPVADPVVKPVADPVVKPVADPVVKPVADPVVKPVADPVVKPVADPVVKPVADPVVKPVADPVVKPVADPVVKPVVKPVADPVVKPVADPVVKPVADPVVKPVADPVVKPVADPVVKPVADPVVKPVVKPVADPVVKPVADPVVKPVVKPVADPVVKPVADPVVKPVADPVVKPVADPVVKPVADPVVKPVADPVVKPVADPVVKPVVKPVADPVVKPVADPVVKPKIKLQIKPVLNPEFQANANLKSQNKMQLEAYADLKDENKMQLQAEADLKDEDALKLIADSDLKSSDGSEYKAIINATSKEGMAPELPSMVTVLNSDGTYKKLEVEWNDVDSINYEKSGEFEIEGSIKDTGEKVKAVVVVISNEEDLPKTGSLVNFNIINSLGLILMSLGAVMVKKSKKRLD
ncbi:S-layer protein [Clostridium putrefaciens]|uniref:S-layer protein n=1 Tax=Clostridium putrefaciens TaxID=99675 RepID=A0A381J6H5_9CLOT|nr:Ig-like domain-containing protein [Clostridium putrefaciens]SUY46079.1 S-layer protein [Clostridium putrefaciens]